MRRDEHLFKTMSAAKDCIAQCLKTSSPSDSLEKYLNFLRSDPQWSEAEVSEVAAVARKAINAAANRAAASPGCGWPLDSQTAQPVLRS